MIKTTPLQNKALVLQAFDTLFNKRDYQAAERYWSSNYIQHSAHIAPGRAGLFDLVRSMPATLKYEPGPIVAKNDFSFRGNQATKARSRLPSPPVKIR
jgi:predicted SnoaL-like aldol condensation-catalyzing enzyme